MSKSEKDYGILSACANGDAVAKGSYYRPQPGQTLNEQRAEAGFPPLESFKPFGTPPGYPHAADPVNHPPHYGGADNPYEAIKVIEAWKLGFNLGNTVKYIAREGQKGMALEDLKKARWYLDREIANREKAR